MRRRFRNATILSCALAAICASAVCGQQLPDESPSDKSTIANEPAEIVQDNVAAESEKGIEDPSHARATLPNDETSSSVSVRREAHSNATSGSTNSQSSSARDDRTLPAPSNRSGSRLGTGNSGNAEGDSMPLPLKLPSSNWIAKTVGALGVVIGLIIFLRPVVRKMAGPLAGMRAPSGVIEGLARYPFGKGQSLVLLKVDSRVLLLCQTAAGANLITEFRDPEDVAGILRRVHDERAESFNRKLEEMLRDDRSANRDLEDARFSTGNDTLGNSIIDLTGEPQGLNSRGLFGRRRRIAREQVEA